MFDLFLYLFSDIRCDGTKHTKLAVTTTPNLQIINTRPSGTIPSQASTTLAASLDSRWGIAARKTQGLADVSLKGMVSSRERFVVSEHESTNSRVLMITSSKLSRPSSTNNMHSSNFENHLMNPTSSEKFEVVNTVTKQGVFRSMNSAYPSVTFAKKRVFSSSEYHGQISTATTTPDLPSTPALAVRDKTLEIINSKLLISMETDSLSILPRSSEVNLDLNSGSKRGIRSKLLESYTESSIIAASMFVLRPASSTEYDYVRLTVSQQSSNTLGQEATSPYSPILSTGLIENEMTKPLNSVPREAIATSCPGLSDSPCINLVTGHSSFFSMSKKLDQSVQTGRIVETTQMPVVEAEGDNAAYSNIASTSDQYAGYFTATTKSSQIMHEDTIRENVDANDVASSAANMFGGISETYVEEKTIEDHLFTLSQAISSMQEIRPISSYENKDKVTPVVSYRVDIKTSEKPPYSLKPPGSDDASVRVLRTYTVPLNVSRETESGHSEIAFGNSPSSVSTNHLSSESNIKLKSKLTDPVSLKVKKTVSTMNEDMQFNLHSMAWNSAGSNKKDATLPIRTSLFGSSTLNPNRDNIVPIMTSSSVQNAPGSIKDDEVFAQPKQSISIPGIIRSLMLRDADSEKSAGSRHSGSIKPDLFSMSVEASFVAKMAIRPTEYLDPRTLPVGRIASLSDYQVVSKVVLSSEQWHQHEEIRPTPSYNSILVSSRRHSFAKEGLNRRSIANELHSSISMHIPSDLEFTAAKHIDVRLSKSAKLNTSETFGEPEYHSKSKSAVTSATYKDISSFVATLSTQTQVVNGLVTITSPDKPIVKMSTEWGTSLVTLQSDSSQSAISNWSVGSTTRSSDASGSKTNKQLPKVLEKPLKGKHTAADQALISNVIPSSAFDLTDGHFITTLLNGNTGTSVDTGYLILPQSYFTEFSVQPSEVFHRYKLISSRRAFVSSSLAQSSVVGSIARNSASIHVRKEQECATCEFAVKSCKSLQ